MKIIKWLYSTIIEPSSICNGAALHAVHIKKKTEKMAYLPRSKNGQSNSGQGNKQREAHWPLQNTNKNTVGSIGSTVRHKASSNTLSQSHQVQSTTHITTAIKTPISARVQTKHSPHKADRDGLTLPDCLATSKSTKFSGKISSKQN